MYFLIYHAAFQSIPQDYAEAAYMDGAGTFTIFFKIMFPMVKNIVTLAMVLQFVGLWSDYSGALYFMPSHPTLSLALLNFSSLSKTSATMQMAACVLLCIPSMLLYAKFSDKFTNNLHDQFHSCLLLQLDHIHLKQYSFQLHCLMKIKIF